MTVSTNESSHHRWQSVALFLCGLLWLCAGVRASSSPTPAGTYVSAESLTAVLKAQNIDRILATLNDIKRMRYQGEILPFIHDLWENRKDKYPDLPWTVIDSPIVRVNVADILIQGRSNGQIRINKTPLHRYVRSQIDSTDTAVAVDAIFALATFDESGDVGAILAVAGKERQPTFRAAVVALAGMCTPAASKALARLGSAVRKPEDKTFLVNTVRQYRSFKTRTHMCDSD